MGYPRLEINLKAVRQNVCVMKALCRGHGIGITGVTKVFCGAPEIANAYLEGGLTCLGDSRVENLMQLQGLPAEKWLLRMPVRSEAEEVVRWADVSLNSEWETITALDRAAARAGRVHKVILMLDLGDLREGYVDPAELLETARRTMELGHIQLYGVGTNLACFSFVYPDREKMEQLAALAQQLPLSGEPVVSGGNSASLHLMLGGGVPKGINNFRLGESLLFGKERCCYTYLPGTRRDGFLLYGEIIELKEKPSMPWGQVGVDSYGNRPEKQADRGYRRRGILALGRQDCDVETMVPVDPGIEILGASSDHMMLDLTDSERTYRLGDTVAFELGYYALLRASTSRYIEKVYVER